MIELYKWMFSFLLSAISSRTLSRRIVLRKASLTALFEEMNRRVAARIEFGVH